MQLHVVCVQKIVNGINFTLWPQISDSSHVQLLQHKCHYIITYNQNYQSYQQIWQSSGKCKASFGWRNRYSHSEAKISFHEFCLNKFGGKIKISHVFKTHRLLWNISVFDITNLLCREWNSSRTRWGLFFDEMHSSWLGWCSLQNHTQECQKIHGKCQCQTCHCGGTLFYTLDIHITPSIMLYQGNNILLPA